jgi:endonuclease III
MNPSKIVEILIDRGTELLHRPPEKVGFTKNEEADSLLNDLEHHPHAFVLACVMDRQIKAERAWVIPWLIKEENGGFGLNLLLRLDDEALKDIFRKKSLHRFNDTMAVAFMDAIRLIQEKYTGNAALIWRNSPRSATVVRRFLEFKGVGVKIATMAANILSREFKIPMQDRIYIDISPDVHVRRVFTRVGFISKQATTEELIYSAREFHPEYPGIFDFSAWEIGRNWCRPTQPDCQNCYLAEFCPKLV